MPPKSKAIPTARLHIHYQAHIGWAHPIRAAIEAKPSLARKDRRWRQSELSDLAFAIETRLGYLPEIIRWIDENLAILGKDFPTGASAAPYLQPIDPLALTVTDRRALQRLLIGLGALVVESRSCFETLARFHQLFLKQYFGESLSLKTSYEAVKRVSRPYGWVQRLRHIRDKLLHERAFWVEFNADPGRQPPYDLVLLLNWRPEATGPRNRVPVSTLREITVGLRRAAVALRQRLVRRVRAVKQ